jgi:hypothetical protein
MEEEELPVLNVFLKRVRLWLNFVTEKVTALSLTHLA